MNNNKLKTDIEEVDKSLEGGLPIDSFISFAQECYNKELQPYQKRLLEDWKHQYQCEFPIADEDFTFKDTKREMRKERCGDCSFFGDKGCTTSYIEAKHGNFHTPACSEFSPKITGFKATMVILDDPIKEEGLI